ncbi:MAG: ORF6N domain-containing protein [Ignavibacteriales bacterium]|nr:ORF6N domain-containing protein [Ignavibacteriales bacterium]
MKQPTLIPSEVIERRILLVRGQKVMLDKHLAELYGVQTRDINKAVNRNIDRFPKDFMFQLSSREFKNLMFHFGTSSWGGTRKRPRVFTEHGILMLSSVLRSKRAVQANIVIMRTFVRLRRMLASNELLSRKLKELERKYDEQFQIVFDAIRQILTPPEKLKRPFGFVIEEPKTSYGVRKRLAG